VLLDRSYFELQAQFASRVEAIDGLSLGEAFRLHTAFYALARDNDAGLEPERNNFDPAHPEWTAFLEALASGSDPVDYAYNAYIAGDGQAEESVSSCFTFNYWPDDRLVRIHFGNDRQGTGLHISTVDDRRDELTSIFSEVAKHHQDARLVRGTSWLYHLDAYRRLFPAAFIAGLASAGYPHQFAALWCQFIDKHGIVKPALAGPFLEAISAATSMAQLDDAFPLDTLAAASPIEVFYDHYGVAPPRQ
jgi:hypothetical protein